MATYRDGVCIPQKLALLIENNKYHKRSNKLEKSKSKVNELRDLLESIGFIVTIGRELDKNGMLRFIKTFCKSIKKDDVIFFYFWGQGCHVNRQNYLIPAYEDQIDSEIDIEDAAISFERQLNRMKEKCLSNITICILDCYRTYDLTESRSSSTNQIQGFAEVTMPRCTLIQFACGLNKTLGNELENLYTKHLLKHIAVENIDIIDVFNSISADVSKESRNQQNPYLMYRLPEDPPFYLNAINSLVPHIPRTSSWKSDARTIVGGHGPGPTLNRLHCPKGIFVSNNGNTFIADSLNHRIIKYARDKNRTHVTFGKGINEYTSERLRQPSAIMYDKVSQSFIICDYKNLRVLRCYRGKSKYAVIAKNVHCYGLSLDNRGFVYISDTERHEVRRYEIGSTRYKVLAGGCGPGNRSHQLNYPTYIYVGKNYELYVSDSGNNRVMKWTEDAAEGVVVAGGYGAGYRLDQLDYPAGIVVDRLNRVYVSDYNNHRVMLWEPGKRKGKVVVGGNLAGDAKNQFNGPEGLTFDRNGNLYVSDSNNHRIQRFSIKKLKL